MLSNINHEYLKRLLGNRVAGSAGLAEGTNANTYQFATNITYTVKGQWASKNATDNLAFSSGHDVQAAGTTRIYAVCVDLAGNMSTVQGESNVLAAPRVSDMSKTVIGYIKVVCDASTAFTPGSTDLGAAGITDTYYNGSEIDDSVFA